MQEAQNYTITFSSPREFSANITYCGSGENRKFTFAFDFPTQYWPQLNSFDSPLIQSEIVKRTEEIFGEFISDFKSSYNISGTDASIAFALFLEWFQQKASDDKEKISYSVPDRPGQKKSTIELGFSLGTRSLAHTGTQKFAFINANKYRVCGGDVDFVSLPREPLASIGSAREIILIHPESDSIKSSYVALQKKLQETPHCLYSPENSNLTREFFGLFMRNSLEQLGPYDTDEKRLNRFFLNSPSNRVKYEIDDREFVEPRKAISLGECIREKIAVCRHYGPLTALMLGRYVKEKGLKDISVHQCRIEWEENNVKYAHTLVLWKDTQNKKLYMIDSTWNKIFDITSREGYQAATAGYQNGGYVKSAVDSVFYRAKMNLPEFGSNVPVNSINPNEQLRNELQKRIHADSGIVKKLILNGADVNTRHNDNGWTPAHVAARCNDTELLQILISKNADFNVKTKNSQVTPLFMDVLTLESIKIILDGLKKKLEPAKYKSLVEEKFKTVLDNKNQNEERDNILKYLAQEKEKLENQTPPVHQKPQQLQQSIQPGLPQELQVLEQENQRLQMENNRINNDKEEILGLNRELLVQLKKQNDQLMQQETLNIRNQQLQEKVQDQSQQNLHLQKQVQNQAQLIQQQEQQILQLQDENQQLRVQSRSSQEIKKLSEINVGLNDQITKAKEELLEQSALTKQIQQDAETLRESNQKLQKEIEALKKSSTESNLNHEALLKENKTLQEKIESLEKTKQSKDGEDKGNSTIDGTVNANVVIQTKKKQTESLPWSNELLIAWGAAFDAFSRFMESEDHIIDNNFYKGESQDIFLLHKNICKINKFITDSKKLKNTGKFLSFQNIYVPVALFSRYLRESGWESKYIKPVDKFLSALIQSENNDKIFSVDLCKQIELFLSLRLQKNADKVERHTGLRQFHSKYGKYDPNSDYLKDFRNEVVGRLDVNQHGFFSDIRRLIKRNSDVAEVYQLTKNAIDKDGQIINVSAASKLMEVLLRTNQKLSAEIKSGPRRTM